MQSCHLIFSMIQNFIRMIILHK